MKRSLRVCLLFLAAFWLPGILAARADAPAPITDPARISHHYREVVARPQFQETEEPGVNTRLEDWLSQWFKRLGFKMGGLQYASRMPAFESLLMTLLAALSVTALFYIMVRLTRRRAGMEAEPLAGIPGQRIFRPPEFYDAEIHQAVQTGDWHTAWLAAWRQFLSQLEYRHLVEADRTRTNREYLSQLRAQTLPASALSLLTGMVDAYDRFIYGRKPIGESEWTLFHQQIDEAGLLLHLGDKAAPSQTKPHTP